jgi:hypothetical protein
MSVLVCRIPEKFGGKDAEIENMREQLVGTHALLAQKESRLQEVQGQFDEEKKGRVGIEVEFSDLKAKGQD